MAYVYPSAYFGTRIVPTSDATLSITSSAVLYGLSVYRSCRSRSHRMGGRRPFASPITTAGW